MDGKVIAAELKKIESRDGRLTPQAVVDAAKAKTSPLHGAFEWNDGVAAREHRLWQARTLISNVKVILEVDKVSVRTIGYVRDPSALAGQQGYRSLVKLASDEDDAREAVVAEFSRAAAHLRRARDIATALGMAAEIEATIARIIDLDGRVRLMSGTSPNA